MTRSVLMLTLVWPLLATSPQINVPGFDPERLARIPVRMKEFVDQGRFAGVVTLLARHGGAPFISAVGYQDIEAKKPMRPDSIFALMSMTKPVTSTGIMILAEEGRLLLTDSVKKHLPEFHGQQVKVNGALQKPSRPITIVDLLTHTSGMPKVPPEEHRDIFFKMDKTLAEAVSIYAQQPLEFEPGTKREYSNTGMATLGRVIEVLSGQRYEKFIEERIFKPLGMRDSFFFPPDDKKDRIAIPYRLTKGKLGPAGPRTPGGDPRQYRKGAKYPCPECGMFSTAQDLAAFFQMMLNGGTYKGKRILSKAAVEVMTMNHVGNLKPAQGLGWFVLTDPRSTLRLMSLGTYAHGGALGTEAWIDPKKDLIGVFLIGRSGENRLMDDFPIFVTMANAAVVD